jgi:hypothetical protein
VSRIARIADPTSKSLGVCTFDYDADGLIDVFEANDTQPNKLYRNNGDGTFIEQGMLAGLIMKMVKPRELWVLMPVTMTEVASRVW